MNFPGVDHWTDIFAVIQRSFFDWLLKLMRKFNKEGLQSACFPGCSVVGLLFTPLPLSHAVELSVDTNADTSRIIFLSTFFEPISHHSTCFKAQQLNSFHALVRSAHFLPPWSLRSVLISITRIMFCCVEWM